MTEQEMSEYSKKLKAIHKRVIGISVDISKKELLDTFYSIRAEYIEIGAVSNAAAIGMRIDNLIGG